MRKRKCGQCAYGNYVVVYPFAEMSRCVTSTNHRKCKRLCTDACANTRQVLESLSSTNLLQQLLGVPTAVLCSGSQRDLSKIAKLDRELYSLKKR